ncbi:MAG: FAD-binding oxidoreductase [Planctomycetia bacterium]|nr:FAD-binding oxidoreductase [Planctomycetia bacterium]
MTSEPLRNPNVAPASATIGARIRGVLGLLCGLRKHDFRAAATWINTMYPGVSPVARIFKFLHWALRQMWCEIPNSLCATTFAPHVSKTPIWLADGNPLENHPWAAAPQASLPQRVHTVVIGAGFTGGALAYHWSRRATAEPGMQMAVLEMGEAASGSSGRNEGLVVMGRYCTMVRDTVLKHLPRVRHDLSESDHRQLALQFAVAYCRAAYRNGDLIEQTIRREGFDCDYARQGWVQARDADQQAALAESVRTALDMGLADWTSIDPDEVRRRTGMTVAHNAGFSIAAASFHPAKWVWSLLNAALRSENVEFYSRTRVLKVELVGDDYHVHTTRGVIEARYVVNAIESYTPLLHPQFHDRILPTQTQAACGEGGPAAMQPHVGISGTRGFFGRHKAHVLVGSDATRVPDREAGRIQPSRFITKFLLGEMRRYFGPSRYHVTHEWSGTVSYTPDEYPIVGVMDGCRQYIIGGMAGSGTGVSFNAARCVVNRILGQTDEPDDYPAEYFAPSRLLDPQGHPWPELER